MKPPPIYQGIYLTLKCNLSCECCCREEISQDRKSQLSYAEVMKSLEETRFYQNDNQVHKVFTGGEPTLWSDAGMD